MSDTTQLIKERLDVVDFVRQYVALSPAGKNLKGLCPFHKEKTPSFIVSPDRQAAHCFGCGFHGDVIGFLMRYENIEFVEALKVLADKAGIDFKSSGPSEQRQYAVLYEINQFAEDFFKNNLKSVTAPAEAARNYLKNRGLKNETLEEFGLGLAPNSSDALSRELLRSGFKLPDIERAGLVFKTERGTYWDRFRNRIMFPIENHFGKVVGFTGRLMPGDEAAANTGKYVNSPETPIFNKSKLLFGFHKSKSAIREARSAVLVEGQMDFLLAWQDGIKNLVATSGTALSQEHLKTLRRLADSLVVFFDNDEAGQAASERAVDLAASFDLSVKVAHLRAVPELSGDFKDPADIARSKPGVLEKIINQAQPAMRYYFASFLGKREAYGGSADVLEFKKRARKVLEKIKMISSQVEQAYWIRELANSVHVPEENLFQELKAITVGARAAAEADQIPKDDSFSENFSRRDLISQRLISLAMAHESRFKYLDEVKDFLSDSYRQIAEFAKNPRQIQLASQYIKLADLISMRSSFETNDANAAEIELGALLKNLKMEYYKEQRELTGLKIREAEHKGDDKALSEALRDFDRISKEIHNI